MSEEILRALMQLFALASDTTYVTNKGREIIKYALLTEIREERVKIFIDMYDDYLKEYHSESANFDDVLHSTQIGLIFEGINNTNLTYVQKIIILFRLLEFAFTDDNISEYEAEFVRILCQTFSIPSNIHQNALAFIKGSASQWPDNSQMLVISKDKNTAGTKNKFIHRPNIDGFLIILYIEEINLYVFRYLGKTNISINNRVVSRDRMHIFNTGAALRSGNMAPIYFHQVASTFFTDSGIDTMTLEANQISYNFEPNEVGLHPFDLKVQTGHLIGIMGGSGSGKSTMVNVLNGNYHPTTGSVTINGYDIHTQNDKIKGIIGFVSQDDLLIEELTVFDNLYYSAKLSFSNFNKIEIIAKVNAMLHSLDLFNEKDLRVGTPIDQVISGGQRKRLNIALELIRSPSILYVDEPTSGLSSLDSEKIMDLLKAQVLNGKLIFVVIHQPSSYIFKLFDRLLLLDRGGYPIYNGDPLESIIYFKKHAHFLDADENECSTCGNVNAEIIFDIIDQKVVDEYGKITEKRKTSPQEWYRKFQNKPLEIKENIRESKENIPYNSQPIPSKFDQFLIFFQRDAFSKLANTQYLIINIFEAPLLAFLISYFVRFSEWTRHGKEPYTFFFNDNIPAYMFMSVVVALFLGMMVSAEEIYKDRKLQKREKFLNLSKGSYLMSKFILLAIISAFQSMLFVWVANAVLEIEDMNLSYGLVMFSTSFFANIVGLNISNSFNVAVNIYILIPFIIIPQLIFSGIIVSYDRLNPAVGSRTVVPVIGEIMALRWAYEALIVNQFKDNPLERQLYPIDHEISHIRYLKSYWITELESELEYINLYLHNEDMSDGVDLMVQIIQRETETHHPGVHFPVLSFKTELNSHSLTPDRIHKIKMYLKDFRVFLNTSFIKLTKKRDITISQIENKYADTFSFNDLKKKYFNQAVTDIVRSNNKFNKVIVVDQKLVPIIDPVFRDARHFRSHFYASTKNFNGHPIDTFWYNLGVIWLMSISLIVCLYFDVFKRMVQFFNKRSSK